MPRSPSSGSSPSKISTFHSLCLVCPPSGRCGPHLPNPLVMDLISGGPPALVQALTGVLTSHAWFMFIPDPGMLRSSESPAASSGVRSFGGSSTYTLSGGQPSTTSSTSNANNSGWKKYAVAPGWVRWLVGGMHEDPAGGSESRSGGTAVVPPRRGQSSSDSKTGGYNWGAGNRLGTE